ncbi:MAG: chemotaxis protein CheW [Halioglobus sp.]|nr:chemotaxis protein CheW [Halioglobus sp.]
MGISSIQSLELLERLYAYDGLASPDLEERAATWVGTSLGIAGVPLLIGAGELEEIIETPLVTKIPGTKDWVIGVAAYKGSLLPVFSGDVLFRGRPYTGRMRDYCMVISRPGQYFAVTLSHVQRDLRFPVEDQVTDQPVDPDFAEYTLGGFMYKGDFLAVLDVDKLVLDDELSNASAGNASAIRRKSNE